MAFRHNMSHIKYDMQNYSENLSRFLCTSIPFYNFPYFRKDIQPINFMSKKDMWHVFDIM